MSMSVGGFIAGPNVAPGNGLGDGGQRLHEWFLPDGDAGQGEPLFADMPPDHIELELLRAVDGPGVTHLRYRVRTAS